MDRISLRYVMPDDHDLATLQELGDILRGDQDIEVVIDRPRPRRRVSTGRSTYTDLVTIDSLFQTLEVTVPWVGGALATQVVAATKAWFQGRFRGREGKPARVKIYGANGAVLAEIATTDEVAFYSLKNKLRSVCQPMR